MLILLTVLMAVPTIFLIWVWVSDTRKSRISLFPFEELAQLKERALADKQSPEKKAGVSLVPVGPRGKDPTPVTSALGVVDAVGVSPLSWALLQNTIMYKARVADDPVQSIYSFKFAIMSKRAHLMPKVTREDFFVSPDRWLYGTNALATPYEDLVKSTPEVHT